MIAREVPVQDVLRVVLQSGTQNLEEVVVTAIGMKKQEKALGYAASTVKGDDLAAARSGSVMSGLTGKVAGVNITSSGGTGSSSESNCTWSFFVQCESAIICRGWCAYPERFSGCWGYE